MTMAEWVRERKDRLQAIGASAQDAGSSVNLSIAGNELQLIVPSAWRSAHPKEQAGEEASVLCISVVDQALEEMISPLNERLERISGGVNALHDALDKTLAVLEKFHASAADGEDDEEEEEDQELEEEDEDDDGGFDMSFDDDAPAAPSAQEEEEDDEPLPSAAAAAAVASPATTQAVVREYRNIIKQIAAACNGTAAAKGGVSPILAGIKVEMPDDGNLFKWNVTLDKSLFKGHPLHKDLSTLEEQRSQEVSVHLEATFPATFPFAPPFMRVVSPEFKFHTGHVTVGGSICMELLTDSGWSPACSFESVLVQIVNAMIEGDGRVEFKSAGSSYSAEAARTAFQRVANAHGWRAKV